ncbi:hypothetical protein, partial [Peptoniphilus hominis (ex Hitch et al. 2025)]
MNKKVISLLLAVLMLLTTIPLNAFAKENNVTEADGELKIETREIGGKSYFYVPIGPLDSKTKNKSMFGLFSIKPNVPTKPGAGQLINASAGLVWQTDDMTFDDMKFPKDGFEAKLILGEGPRTGVTIAKAVVTEPAPAGSKLDGHNNQFITTDDYQVGDENIGCAIVFENKLVANARVSGKFSNKDITGGKCYYFVVTQISMPAYTAEWYDNDSSTRPSINASIFSGVNKEEKIEVFKENLKYGSICDKTPRYIDEYDMEGNHIGMQDFIPTGAINEGALTMSPGQGAKAKGRFNYYEGANGNVDLTNTKQGKIPSFTKWIIVNGQPVQNTYPTYFYNLVGDNNHLWRFQMRQELKVNFDANGGTWKAGKAPDEQIIGHSMKLGETWAGINSITIPAGTELEGSDFSGWSKSKDGPVINNMQDEIITENTTFYAIYNNSAFDPAHVEKMVVKEQPTKLVYTEGEKLALAG